MPSLKFRQDTVRTLPYVSAETKHRKHQCIYWDASFECFGIRVHPSGRRLYVCAYRVSGRKRLATLGRVDVLTLDQARKKAAAYLGKVASQEDPQDETDRLRTTSTVKQLVEAYVENHAKRKKMTWKDDRSVLMRFLIPGFGVRLAPTIGSADIREFIPRLA